MEKKRRLFNGFDVAVVLLVVLAGLGWYLLMGRTVEVETDLDGLATYYIEVPGVTEEVAASFQVGDAIEEGSKNFRLGNITGIEIEPYRIRVTDMESQSFHFAPVPERYTVILQVQAEVDETEQDVKVYGEYAIKGGASISLTGPGYAVTSSFILAVERGV